MKMSNEKFEEAVKLIIRELKKLRGEEN